MNRGYIKVWRKIEDSGIMGNAEVCQLFLWLLLKVTRTPKKYSVGKQMIILQPGQYFTGRKELAKMLKSTEQKIRTCLSSLENHEIINQQTTSKGTIISIINWSKYQDEQPTSNQHFNQRATNEQPTSNQRATTKQEDKNINKKEDINTPPPTPPEGEKGEGGESTPKTPHPKKTDSPSKGDPQYRAFKACFEIYPVRQGEEEAWREWMRLQKNGTLAESYVIRDAIIRLSGEDSRWQRGKVPKMAKWLNGKGWNDEPYIEPDVQPRASPDLRSFEERRGEAVWAEFEKRQKAAEVGT